MRACCMIGFEFRSVSNLIKREFERHFQQTEKYGLTGMHALIVSFLFNNRSCDIFQRDVELAFSIRRSTATGMLKRMEKMGMLVRTPIAYDARLKKLVLTERAIEANGSIMHAINHIEQKLSKGLTKDEIEAFFAVTSKIKKNLQ